MKLSDFDFLLSPERIASYPLPQRSDSRLLLVDRHSGAWQDSHMRQLSHFLRADDLLVFNESKVMPARFFAHKVSGGRVEILVERIVDAHLAWAHVRGSKQLQAGQQLTCDGGIQLEIRCKQAALVLLAFPSDVTVLNVLERIGHMPIPHYFGREAQAIDQQRYQTVYARKLGSVAAPTAGLHFDEHIFKDLAQLGVEQVMLHLHVGAGTFQPVRSENIAEHQMHAEWFEVSAEAAQQISTAQRAGRRIIAIGTTSARALESWAQQSADQTAFAGETRIFIHPGFNFRVVDGLLTNFHLPKSSLLMLVAALLGHTQLMQAYQHAIAAEYRFYSYGDAMLIV